MEPLFEAFLESAYGFIGEGCIRSAPRRWMRAQAGARHVQHACSAHVRQPLTCEQACGSDVHTPSAPPPSPDESETKGHNWHQHNPIIIINPSKVGEIQVYSCFAAARTRFAGESARLPSVSRHSVWPPGCPPSPCCPPTHLPPHAPTFHSATQLPPRCAPTPRAPPRTRTTRCPTSCSSGTSEDACAPRRRGAAKSHAASCCARGARALAYRRHSRPFCMRRPFLLLPLSHDYKPEELLKEEAGLTYTYSYNGAGSSSAWCAARCRRPAPRARPAGAVPRSLGSAVRARAGAGEPPLHNKPPTTCSFKQHLPSITWTYV